MRATGQPHGMRWRLPVLVLALALPPQVQASDSCAGAVLHAAGLAARDVSRAHVPPSAQGEPDAAALAKARKRLARRLAKATHRHVCPAPIDVAPIWDLARRFGADMSALIVRPIGLAGTWTLAGGPIAGHCADHTPSFADALTIREEDGFLEITASSGAFTGRTDGPRFEVSAVYGAINCGATGWYDLNLTITGERLTPSTYHLTQQYSHAVISGTCPACSVTWAGTMTRPPPP